MASRELLSIYLGELDCSEVASELDKSLHNVSAEIQVSRPNYHILMCGIVFNGSIVLIHVRTKLRY